MSVRLRNPMSVIVWLAFLLPGGPLGGRLDFPFAVAVFAVACVVLWVKSAPWESREPARRAAWLFGSLQFLYVLSYLYALAFKGAQPGPQNLLELPRWILLGGFVVYLIRHYDASVRAATESAATAVAYGAWFAFAAAGERTYIAALTLCWFLLFSSSRLRYVHATAAATVLFLTGARPAWAASTEALRLIRLSPVFGWGPARYELAAGAGSQYALWLARGGALGAFLIALGLGFTAYRLLRGEDDLRRRAAVAGFLACAALLLLSGPYLDNYRLFFATAFLLAAVHEHGSVA